MKPALHNSQADAQAGQTRPEAVDLPDSDKPLQLCIVDDERIVCERLQRVFEKHGFLVETFTDSKAAGERLSQKEFDILITDLKMAPPDGIELLQLARQRFPRIKVVVITAFATVEAAREALKGGAVDFVVKPFRLSHLRDLVLKIASEGRAQH
jgi:DNA-binding NtrC family response regulator